MTFFCMASAPNILVVDADEEVTLWLSRLLRHHQWNVITAADGIQAMTMVRQQRPALVLVDVNMPAGGGLFVLESVKKTGKLLVVHEDTRTGGIAGEIAMRVNEKAFEWLDGPILRVTAIDSPVPYSGSLEDFFLPQVSDVIAAARYLARY